MDEPTSALDNRSESFIRETLRNLGADVTVVLIAHRLSTLSICDRIMVMQGGEVRALESKERLAEQSSFYREALDLAGIGPSMPGSQSWSTAI
jgi:ABC-type bacteriocin/lantibiotic exporter with double-glycine peptidase domain